MIVGIPGGLLYEKYKVFLQTFFNELEIDTVVSDKSDQSVLNIGVNNCVDEGCFPIKLFHGHVSRLKDRCDYIVVPRIMRCEFGEYICPKFSGLPELVESGTRKNRNDVKLAFTEPLYLNQPRRTRKTIIKSAAEIGINKRAAKNAYHAALKKHRNYDFHIHDQAYEKTIYLAGHTYNVFDPFANKNIIDKLHKMGIGVITGQKRRRKHTKKEISGFIKNPYWLFMIDSYTDVHLFKDRNAIDGMIYISSFSCGTDSIAIEVIKNTMGDFPILVLKIDEQTGEAGMDTRLEAFGELLKRRDDH